MEKHVFDWDEYAVVARKAAAEGCVLLKNENDCLPIRKGEKVALFGRGQFNYYKSGTGSGGMVNAPYVIGIAEALKLAQESGEVVLDETVEAVYLEWLKDHPFDEGVGWAAEPWNQEEMVPDPEMVREAAARNDMAVIILARTAGEDKDNSDSEGSYRLTADEQAVLDTVSAAFSRVAVVLNVGNIIDMNWAAAPGIGAVLYAWQGGMEGGNGCADVLLGKETPSGKLADTIAYSIQDYPSTADFAQETETFYREDIYVGYRYFETFAKEKVQYPFGFGLSYTTFAVTDASMKQADLPTIMTDAKAAETAPFVTVSASVTNTGAVEGKEVLQLYLKKPQEKLGNPSRELVAFAKTKKLEPKEVQTLELSVSLMQLASYDEIGVYEASSYVVEPGEYVFYLGCDVRSAEPVGRIRIDEAKVLCSCKQAMAPVQAFDRIRPVLTGAKECEEEVACKEGNDAIVSYEPVPLRGYDLKARIEAGRMADRPCTGDKGYRLSDVAEGKVSLETFLDQLEDLDLIHMSRGEGMCSPKVTPGTASAFGGVTDRLVSFGIPTGCCADGPSGIRMDCGSLAFAMPNGTSMACSFNTELVEELYEMEGMDLRRNQIDSLLGPGINIHRNPLNGRNFEYFSEDPLLTGRMAVAQLKGMGKMGVTGTIKHFTANNQEYHRHYLSSVMSERALRQIYLKPYELAVKEGGAFSIMSSYGAVNGIWTAGNYDLLTTILRGEWGFDGIVMTDWWAQINEEGEEPARENTQFMIRAQNDIYMVTGNALQNTGGDHAEQGLADGTITRGDLLRNAANICRVLLKLPVMERAMGKTEEWEVRNQRGGFTETITMQETIDYEDGTVVDLSHADTSKGTCIILNLNTQKRGFYTIEMSLSSQSGELAQIPINIFMGSSLFETVTINGTGGAVITKEIPLVVEVNLGARMRIAFGQGGAVVHKLVFRLDKEVDYFK